MPSPLAGKGSWLPSPRHARSKSSSKPKEVLVTNFDKLFEDDKIRRRAKSCYRSERVFDRRDDSVTRISSPSPSIQPLQSQHQPQCSSYRVVERSSTQTFFDKLTRKPRKSVKEEAEEVRSEVLQICCDPCRSLPGRYETTTMGQRMEMGIDCDEVLPRLILANGKTVKNVSYIKELGVTHIINTASRDVWLPVEKLSNLGLKIFQFHVDDVPSSNISVYFQAASNFLSQAMMSGGLVMVNCLVGLSRSATILTAAVMINNNWSLVRTLKKLRQMRPVKPNIGFMVQLLNLERQLKTQGIKLL